MKMQEKRLKDEIQVLSEKNKQIKVDVQRKEQLLKDQKDRIDSMAEDNSGVREKQAELERQKEIVKKQKLEVEIKDNQVRQLKQKIDMIEGQLDNERSQNQSSILNN
mmetsp:Transcript_3264/g.3235  ORF Transcript_3264/g.3235 Transcript_3264/m.3235 type:complete len:107 (+) Transcript_3264:1651-1971(+)